MALVEHPETGEWVREQKSYIGVDEASLTQEVADNEAHLEEVLSSKRAEFEAQLNQDEEVQAARSAVDESKSDLAQLQSQESGSEDTATDPAAASSDEVPAEDGAASDELGEPDGAVAVAVTVEETVAVEAVDEY